MVILNLETRKVVQRIGLSRHVPYWRDAQPPVWTADSKALCYGDVAGVEKVYRREVRLFDLVGKKDRQLARDAVAVGATAGGIVLNRGPSCQPMAQHISSYIPPGAADDRPKTDGIVFCRLTGKAEPQTLASNAYAQQVLGDALIYARRSGEHVIVMRARLKPVMPPKASTSREP